MRIYYHPKCSTCKSALKFVEAHFHESDYTLIDITLTPPSFPELEKALQFYQSNIKKLFNTSGIQYRELGLTKKLETMSEKDALTLLSQNGMLVKRPFLIEKETCLVGFNETAWKTFASVYK